MDLLLDFLKEYYAEIIAGMLAGIGVIVLVKLFRWFRPKPSQLIPPCHEVLRKFNRPEASYELVSALNLLPVLGLTDQLDRPDLRSQALPGKNMLITGLPGAGKTTLIHEILTTQDDRPKVVVVAGKGFGSYRDHILHLSREKLPEKFTFIYDDFHEVDTDVFQKTMMQLQQQFPGMTLICACRPHVNQEIPKFRDALGLHCQIEVGPLEPEEAEHIVDLCEKSWGIIVPDDTRKWLLEHCNKKYATPLYFISLLAPVRRREDRTARLADLVALPKEALDSVLGIWQEYFKQLSPKCRSFLHAVRLAKDMNLAADVALVSRLLGEFLLVDPRDQMEALEELEQRLWLSVSDGEYSCYDIQLEAVDIPQRVHESFVKWVLDLPVDDNLKLTFLNQVGLMEYNRFFRVEVGATRTWSLNAAADLLQTGVGLCGNGKRPKERAMFSNNASECYSIHAETAENDQQRREALEQALEAIKEAIKIWRRLSLPANVAGSLNNVSNLYSKLASSAENEQQRRDCLQQSVGAIQQAIEIRRRLNLPADLAMSLNNVSLRFFDLAASAENHHQRRGYLEQAGMTTQEAIEICRQLNLPAELAGSLNNASNLYSDLASSAESHEQRRDYLQQAVEAIEESIKIRRRLNLPADLAASLNNASGCYSHLAGSAKKCERRREYLKQAVEAINEAIKIYKRLNLPAELATSLNNASNHYSDLADSAENDQQRTTHLRQAVEAIEEAVQIYKRLSLSTDLAKSLNNVSNRYCDLAESADNDQQRTDCMQQAVAAIEEAIQICRRLNLPAILARSLSNASRCYSNLAGSAGNDDQRRDYLKQGLEASEEAAEMYRRLDLSSDLAMSLNNVSCFFFELANSAESDEQRRESLEQAVDAIQEAIETNRCLNLPLDLAMSLGTSAGICQALAETEKNYKQEFAHRIRAAECIDEAISLFEQTDQNYQLVEAYRHGVRVHTPLMQQRPESVERTRIYAEKAAVLLKAYAKPEEAERFAELARRLSGEQPD